MKKFLLLFLAVLSFEGINAQCVPDTTINQLVVPPAGSTIHNVGGRDVVILPYAYVGQPYDETLQFFIPADTTIGANTAAIDYVKVVDFMGLPSAFNYDCSNDSCYFAGGSYGCANMFGTPTVPDSVELQVAIELGAVIIFPFALQDTLRDYYLVTKASIGLEEKSSGALQARFYPNPASNDMAFLELNAIKPEEITLLISNSVGQAVRSATYQLNAGENTLPIEIGHYSPGVYYYKLQTDDQRGSGRFVIHR